MPRPRKDAVKPAPKQNSPAKPARPEMSSPEWSEFAMGHFKADELQDGCPTHPGLYRVTELLLGPIIRYKPNTVATPTEANQYRAVVEADIAIAFGGRRDDIREFGDVADCYAGNTDVAYARFASSTAFTRAASRAFKKALMLGPGVYAAEEMTAIPASESGLGGFIVLSQQRGIEKMCRECDVDVMKYINSWKNKYNNITHVRYDDAQRFLEHLNELRNDMSRVPESVKGYKSSWREDQD